MDTVDIRAAILSCRVNLQHRRRRAYDARLWDAKTKRRFKLDSATITKLATISKRVIKTLERRMKRANRQFRKAKPWGQLEACSKEWRSHLRWIRFHLAYFNPLPSTLKGSKRLYQARINQLMALAESGIRYFKYEPPEPRELRRIIRLFVRSARRGRISEFIWRELWQRTPSWDAQRSLVEFVDKRTDLQKAVPS